MTSLEVLLLTAISLVIVFAALPYVISTLYASMAPLEYRNAAAYILAFADSLEADFGMVGARKYFPLPNFVYGSFGAVNRTYVFELYCGGVKVPGYSSWRTFEIWYNSTYLVDRSRMYRGINTGLVTFVNDTLIAVNATPPGKLRLYPRVFLVYSGRDGSDAYIYIISSRVYVRGQSYLTYFVSGAPSIQSFDCNSKLTIRVGNSNYALSGTVGKVYVVNQTVAIELR